MKLPIYLLGQLGLKLEQKNELSMMEWVWSYTRAKGRVVDGKGVELEEESSITCFEAEETSSGSEWDRSSSVLLYIRYNESRFLPLLIPRV